MPLEKITSSAHIYTLLGILSCMMLMGIWAMPQRIPGWFFSFSDASLNWTWIFLWLLGTGGASMLISKTRYKVVFLFLVLWLGQYFFSFAGHTPLIDQAIYSGHAEFVITGSRDLNVTAAIENYEEFVQQDTQQYARSKPPGQVVLYLLLGKLAPSVDRPLITGFVDPAHMNLAILLSLVLPLLASLTVFPMYAWTQSFMKKDAWFPVFLYACSAPPLLISMHFDQAVYPLIFCSFLWILSVAARQESINKHIILSLLGGILLGSGLFVSFSFLGGIPLVIALGVHHALSKVQWTTSAFAISLGIILVHIILWFQYAYNPFIRYQDAMIHHAGWKGFPWTWGNWWIATRVNITEFFWFLGPLSAWIFVPHTNTRILSRGLWCTFIFLLFFGKAAGEVARLWLFFFPVIWVVVAPSFSSHKKTAILCTALWAVVLKWLMDL